MSYKNNNVFPLAWYDEQSQQNHRKRYAFGVVWPLIAQNKRLPPFQYKRNTHIGEDLFSFFLINRATGVEVDILPQMIAGGLEIVTFNPVNGDPAYDLIKYPGLLPLDLETPEGQYECRMTWGTDDTAVFKYSEVFSIRYDITDLITLSWWHDQPFALNKHLGHISYADPYYNFMFFEGEIQRPEYPLEEEAVRRDGYKFPIYQVSQKTHRIPTLLCPEYVCDALRLVELHHHVIIEQYGVHYEVDDIKITFGKWLDQGSLCPVSIEFHTDTVVQTAGLITPSNEGGDYNQFDYNDDHYIGFP